MSGLEPFFLGLQDELRAALGTGALIPHPGAKGDASELNWAGMLERHLPQRHRVVTKCFVLDHRGDLSHEIDIVLADRQYSPIVFQSGARQVIPAEAVYAVFEVKPQTDRENVLYSAGKARSVRALDRTNAPVPTRGGGIADPAEPGPILGGLLTTRCAWKSGLGAPFMKAIREQPAEGRLDIGCALDSAGWTIGYEPDEPSLRVSDQQRALVFFFVTLLRGLQRIPTVPAMDFEVWGSFLEGDSG